MITVSITSMRNQAAKAERIAQGYAACSLKPDLCVFVLDRCTDQTRQILEAALQNTGVKFALLEAPWCDDIFAAGRPRDWAVDQVRAYLLPSVNCFVFLDGDCIPSRDLFKEHERIQNQVHPYPCLVNGAREDEMLDGSIARDKRLANKSIFTPGMDTVTCLASHLYVDAHALVPSCWGCNVSLNLSALLLARALNKLLFGDMNRAFTSCFDGNWGGEDPFLAATLFRVNCMLVNLDPDKSHVLHTWHDGAHRNNKHAGVLQVALRKFRNSLTSCRLRVQGTEVSNIGVRADSLTVQACAQVQDYHGRCLDQALLALSRVAFTHDKTGVDMVVSLRDRCYLDIVEALQDHVFDFSLFPDAWSKQFLEPVVVPDQWCYWLDYKVQTLC